MLLFGKTKCWNQQVSETWTKNTYVCDPDECDTLIEVTSNDKFGFPSGSVRNVTCPCGRTPVLVSVLDATIPPMNERNNMETTTEVPTTYNANVLVTYKDIIDGAPIVTGKQIGRAHV